MILAFEYTQTSFTDKCFSKNSNWKQFVTDVLFVHLMACFCFFNYNGLPLLLLTLVTRNPRGSKIPQLHAFKNHICKMLHCNRNNVLVTEKKSTNKIKWTVHRSKWGQINQLRFLKFLATWHHKMCNKIISMFHQAFSRGDKK